MRKESGGAQRLAGEQQGPENSPLNMDSQPLLCMHTTRVARECRVLGPGP